ncbi:MAG: hypothetical protein KAT70_09205 [Thermoplasmata archaeon]|nr:hypothetical protein [Thermoplasmata archaeon]
MRRLSILVMAVLIAAVSSAGCIDIEWAKDTLIPVDVDDTRYFNNYTNISHTFETDPDDLSSLAYTGFVLVNVTNGSLYIDMRVRVQRDELPDGSAIKDVVDNMSEQMDLERMVKVTLSKPGQGGEEVYSVTYNVTTHQPDQWPKFPSPEPGNWRIDVEAEGVGYGSFHDGFEVTAIVRMPTGS